MKKLITIFLFLIISCGVTKDKTKFKSDFDQSSAAKTNFSNDMSKKVDSTGNKKDSLFTKLNQSTVKADLSVLQNFNLKNTGKCGDGGTTRFVNFTDAAGNKTSIPVNDNTELNFNNSTDLKKQIESLSQELTEVKTENTQLKSKLDLKAKGSTTTNKKSSGSTGETNVKTKKSSFASYAFVGLLCIVVYELLRQFIKKLITIKKLT